MSLRPTEIGCFGVSRSHREMLMCGWMCGISIAEGTNIHFMYVRKKKSFGHKRGRQEIVVRDTRHHWRFSFSYSSCTITLLLPLVAATAAAALSDHSFRSWSWWILNRLYSVQSVHLWLQLLFLYTNIKSYSCKPELMVSKIKSHV